MKIVSFSSTLTSPHPSFLIRSTSHCPITPPQPHSPNALKSTIEYTYAGVGEETRAALFIYPRYFGISIYPSIHLQLSHTYVGHLADDSPSCRPGPRRTTARYVCMHACCAPPPTPTLLFPSRHIQITPKNQKNQKNPIQPLASLSGIDRAKRFLPMPSILEDQSRSSRSIQHRDDHNSCFFLLSFLFFFFSFWWKGREGSGKERGGGGLATRG